MPDQPLPNIDSDEISLKELVLNLQEWVRYLRSKWVIILIAGIIGGSLGLAYSLYKKPVYTATLTFALEEKGTGGSLSGYAGLASQFGIDLAGGSSGIFSGDNISELMKSRLMVTKTLLSEVKVNGREQSLADYYINFNHFRDDWKKSGKIPAGFSFSINISPDSLSYIQDSLMGNFYQQLLKSNLTVDKPDKKLSIIAVTCKSTNELFAQYFTEALVKNVSAFYIQTKTKRSAANVDILQNRLDSVRRAYNSALFGTAITTDQNLNPARAVVSVPRIRSQSEAQILGAEYAELVKNLEIAKMALLQETPLVQVIDKPVMPLNKERVGKLKGIVLGILLFLSFIVIALIIKQIMKKVLSE